MLAKNKYSIRGLLLMCTAIWLSSHMYGQTQTLSNSNQPTLAVPIEGSQALLLSAPANSSTCGTGAGQVSFTITALVDTDYNGQDVSCNGADDATICCNIEGGVGPFEFQWFPEGPTTQCWEDRGVGTYQVLVRDVGQDVLCATTVEVSEPAPLALFDVFLTEPTCVGDCNGSAFPLPIGGTGEYNITWNGTLETGIISNVCEGNNDLVVIDENGCQLDSTMVIELNQVIPNLTVTDLICFDENTGAAEVNPEGGSGGPITITWSTGDTGPSISNQPAGNYSVEIEDDGCIVTEEFTIGTPDELEIFLLATSDPSCPGTLDGEIQVAVIGGIEPYTISWSGPNGFVSSEEDLADLDAGIYVMTVVDDNGCEVESNPIELEAAPQIDFNPVIVPQSCLDANNGAISPNPSNGLEPYLFSWSGPDGFNSSAQNIADLFAGTYTLTIIDDGGCFTIQEFEVPDEAIEVDSSITTPLCAGDFTGEIQIDITGGSGAYSTTWNGPNGFSSTQEDISGLDVGEYTLVISDNASCTQVFVFEIVPPNPFEISWIIDQPFCETDLVSIDLDPQGGAAPLTILWTSDLGYNSNDIDILNEAQAVYQLTVSDFNGCQFEQTFDLTTTPLTVSALLTDPDCSGANNGAIALAVQGGNPNYTFLWSGPNVDGETLEDLSQLDEGSYEVVVTDSEGCQTTANFELERPEELQATFNTTDVLCFGGNTGAITPQVSGGFGNPTYAWTGPNSFSSSSPMIDNLVAGTYAVTINDGLCFFETIIEIDQPTQITADAILTSESCFGEGDGAIDILLDGGVNPFVISWDGPENFESNDQDISSLEPGSYIATISDENGCNTSFTIEVEPGTEILFDVAITNTQCGLADGVANATIAGGEEPYVFTWFDGQTIIGNEALIENLAAGSYTLQVSENGGCASETTISISDTESAALNAVVEQPSCSGDLNASIAIDPQGEAPPFIVEWEAPLSGSALTQSGLSPGTYSVSVTDDNGCITSETFQINNPDAIDATALIDDEQCGGSPGAIIVDANGGTGDLTFSWTGPNDYTNNTQSILGIPAGTYILVIEDEKNCSITYTYEVEENSSIVIEALTVDNLCANAGPTGAIDVEVSGGQSPYNLSWTFEGEEISTSEDLSGVVAGDYTLTVTDNINCVESMTFTINELDPIEILFDADQPDCAVANGSITAQPQSGQEPFTFQWSLLEGGNSTFMGDTPSISGLATGSYEVVVTDTNGCTNSAIFDLTNDPGEVTVDLTQPLCFGDSNGAIDITVTGVVAPLTFEWSDDMGNLLPSTEDQENLEAGIYTVIVTDFNGCEVPATIDLDQPDDLALSLAVSPAGCDGTPIGEIQPGLFGGTPEHSFNWAGPNGFTSSDTFITDLEIGDYTIEIVDANGCSISANAFVPLAENLEVFPDITNVLCNGAATGSIALTTLNGEPEIEFAWTGPNGFTSSGSEITDLVAGVYDVIINDQTNCLVDTFFTVTENEPFDILLTSEQPQCFGDTTGCIQLQAFSATGALSVLWEGPSGFSSSDFSMCELPAGEYTYTLSDPLGCSVSGSETIIAPEVIVIDIAVNYGDCIENRGGLSAAITGGTEPYEYTWSSNGGLISTETSVNSVSPGNYTLDIVDAHGCTQSATVEVINLDPVVLTLDSMGFTPCPSAENGFIAITAEGGQGALNYTWTADNGFESTDEDVFDLAIGVYEVYVSDPFGCDATISDLEIIATGNLAIEPMSDQGQCIPIGGLTLVGEATEAEDTFWTDLDGNALSDNDILLLNEAGSYELIFHAIAGECEERDTVSVNLYPQPLADAGQDLFLYADQIGILGGNPVTDSEDYTVTWSDSDLLTILGNQQAEVVLNNNELTFTLDVVTPFGCVASDTVDVFFIPEIVIPTGFSPNDDGVNDIWEILNWQLYPSLQVTVFNRWGDILYTSKDGYNQPWDGYHQGKRLPVGSYYYAIEINEPEYQEVLTGPITILE